jgi:hypothetical protein
MAVPIWIIAFAIGFSVPLIRLIRIVQSMRSVKVCFPGYVDQNGFILFENQKRNKYGLIVVPEEVALKKPCIS